MPGPWIKDTIPSMPVISPSLTNKVIGVNADSKSIGYDTENDSPILS